MKTLINFAAQQLSKKRMNDVKGGGLWFCRSCNSKGEVTGEIDVGFKDGREDLAKEAVAQAIGPGQVADCRVVE